MIKKNKINLHMLSIETEKVPCGFIQVTFWCPLLFLPLNKIDENFKKLQNNVSFTLSVDIGSRSLDFRSNINRYLIKGSYSDKTFFIVKLFVYDLTRRLVLEDGRGLNYVSTAGYF